MDDYIILYLERRDGTVLETQIDLEDLKKVEDFGYKWHSRYDKALGGYYAVSSVYMTGGHRSYVYLHRYLMNCEPGDGMHVDHEDHDTLNNRKYNLRVSEVGNNTKNRSAKNSNNTSGYRNVCEINGKWVVQLQINGKNIRLGRFDDVNRAGEFAEKMRVKYYGEFKGNN